MAITVAHALLLGRRGRAGAMRRGRNDIGGMLDVSVGDIGLGGLLWTALLFPRLTAMGPVWADNSPLLVSVLVLLGCAGRA